MPKDVKTAIEKVLSIRFTDAVFAKFRRELNFLDCSVENLIEVGSYISIAADVYSSERATWSRNEAILGGNMVRLYKLILMIVDQSRQSRGEFIGGLIRLAYETIVTIKFLIKNPTEENFDSYVKYSLMQKKKLHDKVTDQIAAAGREPWTIEERILKSIQSVFEKLEYSIDDIDGQNPKNLANKSIYDKAKDVGLEKYYIEFYRIGSSFIHGNFADLYEFHLQPVEGGYKAVQTFKCPRPQPNSALALIACDTVEEYFGYLEGENLVEKEIVTLVSNRIDDLKNSIVQLAQAHERFLNK